MAVRAFRPVIGNHVLPTGNAVWKKVLAARALDCERVRVMVRTLRLVTFTGDLQYGQGISSWAR